MTDTPGEERHRQTKFGIPATARAGTTGQRKAENLGNSWVSERRSDFYMEGDVIAYPILDAHSVSASMAPFVGTTMTFAHTGREELDDSYFFKLPSELELSSVRQEPFTVEEHRDAIHRAITRLQLVELNKYLANRPLKAAKAFQHMNSFETELLPRIAELLVLSMTDSKHWDWREWVRRSATVDLDENTLRAITQMDSGALAWLIVASQKHLLDKSFVSDVNELRKHIREFTALNTRLTTPFVPQNARRF